MDEVDPGGPKEPADYAYTPSAKDAKEALFFEMLKARPNTVVLPLGAREADSLGWFESKLAALRSDARPIDELLIVSHANLKGELSLNLTDKIHGPINFDNLRAALEKNPNVVALAPSLFKPAPDAGVRPALAVNFRGCSLGRAVPFMKLLQTALGRFGPVKITAPRHLHYVFRVTEKEVVKGYAECMCRELVKYYPGTKAKKEHPVTRKQLVDAIVEDERLLASDAFPLDRTLLQKYIPKVLPTFGREPPISFTLAFDPSWGISRLSSIAGAPPATFGLSHDSVDGITAGRLADNASAEARRAHVKAALLKEVGQRYVKRSPDDFPIFERFGFTDIDTYVDAFDWTDEGGGAWYGTRLAYRLTFPITDPVTNYLLGNWYPVGEDAPEPAMRETDKRLFAVVEPAV